MSIIWITPQGLSVQRDPASLLTPELRETARVEANQWIKRLRLVRYGDATMRDRFTYKHDSLWWFTELYLHKMKRLDAAVETVLALTAARDEGASRFVVDAGDPATRDAALAFGRARGVPVEVRGDVPRARGTGWPSFLIGLTARASRVRPAHVRIPPRQPAVAAFVHTAFWRTEDPQHETYVGPILDALVRESGPGGVFFVGLGPRRNFKARRWWDAMTPATGPRPPITAIERLAPARALKGSLGLWRSRRQLAADVVDGPDVRAAGVFHGCDLWPVLERELRAAALVQWPWSARAMDEAGASLDALEPGVALTYAEAGGWGRALMLEARRRGIPSAGIQHGFIYRHWLNYTHQADEMEARGDDRGFPAPDRTLVYDRYAAEQLGRQGGFSGARISVTGSARLEGLSSRLAVLREQRDEIRQRLGVRPDQRLVVLASKFSEIHLELPDVVTAIGALPDVRLVIKTHPAETPDLYQPFVSSGERISIAAARADLAELLAAADALVTMNSTVAIDGLVLGIPALVVGLPSNLSPFVDAGVMLGAGGAEKIQQGLESLLYDRQIRQGLAERAEGFVSRYGLAPERGAADRAAGEILALARGTTGP